MIIFIYQQLNYKNSKRKKMKNLYRDYKEICIEKCSSLEKLVSSIKNKKKMYVQRLNY